MARPNTIPLGRALEVPILYEDRAVLAIDKPAHWMLAPSDWDRTGRNLQLALTSAINGREFWASSRNLKFLRFVHRLDAETTGVLLFAKSAGSLPVLSKLFESRSIHKIYFAVVTGIPAQSEWTCAKPLAPDPRNSGKMKVDQQGKPAETKFKVIETLDGRALIQANPLTGRTHQIRIHLEESGFPIIGDEVYGGVATNSEAFPIALRAAELSYRDPFSGKPVLIRARMREFTREFGLPPFDFK